MIIIRLFTTAVLLSNLCYNAFADEVTSSNHPPRDDTSYADDDVLSSNLISWLRANGAYINEKLVVKYNGSYRGVFATEDMEKGETLCSIPSDLIIRHKELIDGEQYSQCGTIRAVMEAMSGDDDDDINDNNITPYGKYLTAQPKGYLPAYWSESGRELLANMLRSKRETEMTAYDELPPRGVHEMLDELKQECNPAGDLVNDPQYIFAAMLVTARADYDYMLPFYDMFNHDNGKYNMKHTYDPYKEEEKDTFLSGFVTTKPIKAGEELYNSYNRCNICYEYFDSQGTPELFLNFGFVESIPQRWLFDFARVKFELEWKDGDESKGEVVVNFLVPFSEKGKSLLQEELIRLKYSFEAKHRNKGHKDYEGMSQYEWTMLWQYYDALVGAMTYAVEGNVPLSDEVWNMGNDWWIQDGTLKETDGYEHYVLRTKRQDVTLKDSENDQYAHRSKSYITVSGEEL